MLLLITNNFYFYKKKTFIQIQLIHVDYKRKTIDTNQTNLFEACIMQLKKYKKKIITIFKNKTNSTCLRNKRDDIKQYLNKKIIIKKKVRR
jgi:hypothetical protein